MMIIYIYILGWSDFFIPYCACIFEKDILVNFCEKEIRNLKISLLKNKKKSRKLLERALIYIVHTYIYRVI